MSMLDTDPLLCCPVCLDEFNETTCIPKFLDCFHSSCATCLNEIYSDGEIECPTCRHVTAPDDGPEQLDTNFYLSHFRDLIQNKFPLLVTEKKRNGIWCQECTGLATIECINKKHGISGYDEYVAVLQRKRDAKIEAALENKERLLKQNEDMELFLKSLDKVGDLMKKALDDSKAKILEHGKEINAGLKEDADEVELAGAVERLKTLEEWVNTEGRRPAELGKFYQEVGAKLEGAADALVGVLTAEREDTYEWKIKDSDEISTSQQKVRKFIFYAENKTKYP